MQYRFAAVLGMAGLALAQLTPPGTSNLGIPAVPGTRVPESNPGTAIAPPAVSAGSSAPVVNPGTAAPTPGSSSAGPAYSFGAAPPPVVAPGK
jgi:hypothetical protein